jgi:hypothetical protein
MNTNKSIFASQHILAMKVADIFNIGKKERFLAMKNNKTQLPSPHTIYEKEIVIEYLRSISSGSDNFVNHKAKKVITISRLFRQREKSRFGFAAKTEKNDSITQGIEVPSFISKLISKTFSMYSLSERPSKVDDEIFYNDENSQKKISERDEWAEFIYSFNGGLKNDKSMRKLSENEEFILLNKFNSA